MSERLAKNRKSLTVACLVLYLTSMAIGHFAAPCRGLKGVMEQPEFSAAVAVLTPDFPFKWV